jgi:hypothetical protein
MVYRPERLGQYVSLWFANCNVAKQKPRPGGLMTEERTVPEVRALPHQSNPAALPPSKDRDRMTRKIMRVSTT